MNMPVWKCKACGCLWRDNLDNTVSLLNTDQKSCASCERTPPREACEIHWLQMESPTPPNADVPPAEPRFYVDTETDGIYTHYVIKDRQTGTTRPFAGGAISDKRRADAIADQCNQHVPPDSL